MKKRIFSRLMAMVMALSLLSTSALAFEVNQKYVNGLTSKTDDLGNSYVELSENNEGDSNYILVEDINTNYTLRFSGSDTNATLDLNGWTLRHTGYTGSVIAVTDGSKLTLEDTSKKDEDGNTKGTITGGHGTKVADGYGSCDVGGGVCVDAATFVMNGGNIKGNYANWGGGIFADNGADVTMTGGRISENRGGGCGSAIMLSGNSSVDLQGGAIAENFRSYGTTSAGRKEIYDGTGIYFQDEESTINVGSDVAICGVKEWTGSFGSAVRHIYLPATCTQPIRCKGCGEVVPGTAPLGHHHAEIRGAKAATCTEEGYTGDTWCLDCNTMIEEGTAIALLPHTSGTPVRENEVAAQPGSTGSYDEAVYCTVCGDEISRTPMTIPALPMPIDFGDGFTGGDADTTIDDETTPLAGIVTEAQLLDELYKHEGSPEVETVEKYASHEYAPAISWALANAIVVDDEDFDPDKAVTVVLLREVLTGYVAYKDIDFTVTVTGEDDELVLDLSEHLNMFFAELEK